MEEASARNFGPVAISAVGGRKGSAATRKKYGRENCGRLAPNLLLEPRRGQIYRRFDF